MDTGFATGFDTDADDKDPVNFSWDFGDGNSANGNNISNIYIAPGNKYNITLLASSVLTGCKDTQKSDSLVFTYPKPEAGFSVNHTIVYNDKPEVIFTNLSSGADSYYWNFGDNTTSVEENPMHKFAGTGYKKILLEAVNDYRCSDTISHEVLVAFSKIFTPNAFSPNAPNKIDREFKLGSEAIKAEGYHLSIMNRWNDIVFETKNEIKGWDGKMKSGDNAPAGNYIWVLDFVDFLGRNHKQSGTVTLIY